MTTVTYAIHDSTICGQPAVKVTRIVATKDTCSFHEVCRFVAWRSRESAIRDAVDTVRRMRKAGALR